MQSFYDTFRHAWGIFFCRLAIFSVLAGLFSTSLLYGHPSAAAPPPTAPSQLSATVFSSAHIELTWTDNSDNETGFKIEIKFDDAEDFTQIAIVGANVTSYASTELIPGTEYFYRVRAYNASGNSGYSNEVNATTLPDFPAAPTELTATAINNFKISLAWEDHSSDENGFKIERKLSSAATFTEIATVGPNVQSYESTGLNPNTAYSYRVAAYNVAGNSGYSNVATATTLQNVPKAPSNLAAIVKSANQINLTWTDNSGNEGGFKIERKTAAAANYTQIATVGANIKSYSNTGLNANTGYSYRVRAYNAGGNSDYANAASATTLRNLPKAPGNLTATPASSNKIVLAWVDSSNNEGGFKIESKTVAAETYTQIATVGANVKTFANVNLLANTEYFYRVRAYNNGGNSAYTNAASAVTLPAPPAAPSNLSAAAVNQLQIALTWVDNATDEKGFKIERKTGAGAYTQIANIGANMTDFVDSYLQPNTTYFYQVRAYNAGGHSAYSNAADAIPFSNINLALHQPVAASSTDSSSAPHLAVDGNDLTYWRSGNVNASMPLAWLRVQLSAGTAVPVDRVVIRWYQNYYAIEYEVQVSNDGTSWATVYSKTAGTAGTADFSFPQTAAKYVRLYMQKHEKSNYRIIEFEAYANSSIAKNANNADHTAAIPAVMTLAQNYPNPFSANGTFGNPTTLIRFGLPRETEVKLEILNLAGQHVATLLDGRKAAGYHEVRFEASNLASGMYFYRLTAPQAGLSVMKKLMLMR